MKKLRSGFTTGACAAAAAKGAALALLCGTQVSCVEIPFPDGRRIEFVLTRDALPADTPEKTYAGVIKDAGDDPDVTNGALIAASVTINLSPDQETPRIEIIGGEGVGKVTKAGLPVQIGRSAINPVPHKMIQEAVAEAIGESSLESDTYLTVEIIVPRGKELAEKTLNSRLGIIGGISILGTTGIVKPVSADAWTATITASMEVAAAGGCTEIVLSTGRTSEAALQQSFQFKPEAFIMMGDFLEFSLQEARNYQFSRLHMAGMWGKILKAALKIPHTHVRFGALEMENAIRLIDTLSSGDDVSFLNGANTAREIYERLVNRDRFQVVEKVCQAAKQYHEEVSGVAVTVYLVHHNRSIKVITE